VPGTQTIDAVDVRGAQGKPRPMCCLPGAVLGERRNIKVHKINKLLKGAFRCG